MYRLNLVNQTLFQLSLPKINELEELEKMPEVQLKLVLDDLLKFFRIQKEYEIKTLIKKIGG
jgi:hypothetical protein